MADSIYDSTIGGLQSRDELPADEPERHLGNIANADTPGYKAKTMEFEDALRDALKISGRLQMEGSDPEHFTKADPGASTPRSTTIPTAWSRSTATRSTATPSRSRLAENQLLYDASAEMLKRKLGDAEVRDQRRRRQQIMDFFSSMRVSATGLDAQQKRMNTISSNIANAETTETGRGRPLQAQGSGFMAATRTARLRRDPRAPSTSRPRACRSTEIEEDTRPRAWSTTRKHPRRERGRLRGHAQREPGRGDGQHDRASALTRPTSPR